MREKNTIILSFKRFSSSRWLRTLSVFALILAVVRFYPHEALSQRIPLSTAVWSADGELLRVTLAADEQYRLWTPLNEMSPELIDAFLLKEDRWFYWHPGVNPVSLVRAGFRTWHGPERQGASTLTMQVARMIYRLNTRTATGKLRQIGAALWLEVRYSKRDLIEAYLNLAPFGSNIEGVGAASRIYFGKSPAYVTLAEALTLAVIPQHPSTRAGRPDGAGNDSQDKGMLSARSKLGILWLKNHPAIQGQERQVDLEIVARRQYAMPQQAPHFVNALLSDSSRTTGTPRIETTLDAGLQKLVERQIQRYIDQYGNRGIRNVAALLVDSRDMSVKAWVGSADFRNEAIDGQVNGVLAKRSPGSTLKPFIYALGLDQGVLHPQTILRDSPTAFGPFTPENFDGRFFGPITAQEALIRSRNIPAVWVATQITQPNLYQFLQNAAVSRLQPEEHYGLSLVLGGGEVTMEELTGLYAMLANHGVLRPLRMEVPANAVGETKADEGVQLISPEASFITLDMLRHNPRPDDDGSVSLRSRWPVAWKTGTSWGFRDAWSAGVAGPYVLTVWIGDFSGQGNPSFIGVDAAAPLFFRIVDALNLERGKEYAAASAPPSGVSKVSVCAESGDLPNAYCPHTVDTWYIPGKSPIRVSQLHRAIAIDIRSGRPACPPYEPGATRFEIYEFWSSDMLKLFREAGMPRRVPPPLPDCVSEQTGDPPVIASPLRGVSYSLHRKAPEEVIHLEARVAADVQNVFWFDGRALIGNGAVSGNSMPWRPTADGVHLIRIVDDHGRAAEREVRIQLLP